MVPEIVNRVALSPLVTFDPADLYVAGDRVLIDIKDQLFMGQLLREKDFRAWIEAEDWSEYKDKHVAVFCTADAIIPDWAFMLLATVLQAHAKTLVYGNLEFLEIQLFFKKLEEVDFEEFKGKKIVIKGCGDIKIPLAVYVEITRRFTEVAEKIMYGEPCSTVPLYKNSNH